MKKLENGQVEATEEEKSILEETAAQAAQKALDEAGLKKPIAGQKEALNPGTESDGAEFKGKENERPAETRMRLKKAVHAVTGGGLALENAPKELKTWRFFDARVNMIEGKASERDFETVAAVLGIKKDLVGASGEGAKLVPDEFGTDIITATEQYTAAGDCTQHTMTSDVKTLRASNAKVTVYQVSEATAPTASSPTFTNPSLAAKAFAGMLVVSKEFFKDNNVDAYAAFVRDYAEALGANRDSEILGAGSAFTSIIGSTTPQVETLVGTGFTDIKYENIVNVISKLSDAKIGNNAKFYMHRTIWGYIQGLRDDNNHPIVQNPFDRRERSLLGYPVYLSEQMTSTSAAATGFLIFGNLKWCDFGTRDLLEVNLFNQGTFNSVNLGEARSLAIFVDERWAFVVSQPSYLAIMKTAAA